MGPCASGNHCWVWWTFFAFWQRILFPEEWCTLRSSGTYALLSLEKSCISPKHAIEYNLTLSSGPPYRPQSAFFCSLVYHLVVEYPLVKSWLIGYIGNYDDATAAAIIVGLFVVKSVWESVGTSHHQPKRIPARKRKTQWCGSISNPHFSAWWRSPRINEI